MTGRDYVAQASRRRFGLGADERVYAALQLAHKLQPDFDAACAELCARDPRARVVRLRPKAATAAAALEARARAAFVANADARGGVGGPAAAAAAAEARYTRCAVWLDVLPHDAMLALYALARALALSSSSDSRGSDS